MRFSEEFMKKDGPYSWLVLLAIIVTNFCCMGYLVGSASIYSEVYPRLLNKDITVTNVIGSTLMGVFMFSAPFNTILLAVVGCRIATLLSVFLFLIGVVSSAFCTEIWHFILGYSIFVGVGASMNVVASIAIVPSYFEKRKPAAYSGLGLGEGIALVVLPYILSALLEDHGFKYTVLYICPFLALCITAPILFIPKPDTVQPRVGAIALFKSYFKPLHAFISPFYLLSAYCLQGAIAGILLLLFNFVMVRSHNAVAVLCFIILGAGSLTSTLIFSAYLLRFSLNHYLLHIVINLFIGICVFIISAVSSDIVFYVCFAVIGVCFGLIIANIGCITSHIFEAKDVEYAFGFHQLVSGVAGVVVPLTAGVIQSRYSDVAALYYIGGHQMLAVIALIIPVLVRPHLFKPKQNNVMPTHSEGRSGTSDDAMDQDGSKKDDTEMTDTAIGDEEKTMLEL